MSQITLFLYLVTNLSFVKYAGTTQEKSELSERAGAGDQETYWSLWWRSLWN